MYLHSMDKFGVIKWDKCRDIPSAKNSENPSYVLTRDLAFNVSQTRLSTQKTKKKPNYDKITG